MSLLFIPFVALVEPTKALTAQPPITIPGGPGSFDFMGIDEKDRFAFACQPGRSAIVVINLDSQEVKSVPLGVACNGVAADSKGKKLYASGPGKALVQVDMNDWKTVSTLPLEGPGDSVIFDSKSSMVYVDNDDGTSLWMVDSATMKILATVRIKEAPEVMTLDTKRGKIFQNIKTSNSLQVIDLATKSVTAEYSLGDLTSPHGLAEDRKDGKLFAVGKNGKLVILDADTGKILTTLDVVKNSDQIAYDNKLKRLYIPGSGSMQTVQIAEAGASILANEPLPAGCHSVTVDTKSHDVWVAYKDAAGSYVMRFSASVPEKTAAN